MIWECKICPDLPCRADTGTNCPPHSCLWCTDFKGHRWVQVRDHKVARRKLRTYPSLSIKDIAKSSRVCPVDPQIDMEAEDLARQVESVVLGVQA